MNTFAKFKIERVNSIIFSVLAGSLTLLTPSEAQAIRLRVTVQNISPAQGVLFSPFWVGFHDGNFDIFTPGEAASLPLEIVAEDGIIGLETTTPEFSELLELAMAFKTELPNQEDTIAALFAVSQLEGIQNIAFANPFGFPPQSQDSFIVDVDPRIHNSLSYASMAVPTHDGFVADVNPITLFSPEGIFMPQQIEIRGADVFDAGTEVNDEDPNTTPILFDPPERFFGAVRQGMPEDVVIQQHPLLRERGQGGFLDLPPYVNSDFSRNPDEIIAVITVEQISVPEPNLSLGLGIVFGLWGLIKASLSRK